MGIKNPAGAGSISRVPRVAPQSAPARIPTPRVARDLKFAAKGYSPSAAGAPVFAVRVEAWPARPPVLNPSNRSRSPSAAEQSVERSPSVPPRIYFPNHGPYLHSTRVLLQCIPQSGFGLSISQLRFCTYPKELSCTSGRFPHLVLILLSLQNVPTRSPAPDKWLSAFTRFRLI